MSSAEESKPEGHGISKKYSVTEDLHIAGSSSKAEENSASTTSNIIDKKVKKPLEDIKEEHTTVPQSIEKSEGKGDKTTQSNIANSSALQKQQQKKQSVKTLAELTQKLKSELRKTSSEIEKSDIEFDRLVGNLEKKIEALRVQLSSSK